MNSKDLEQIVANAVMIVGGYAFSRMDNGYIRIVGLQSPNHALVLSQTGQVLETSMNDVELEIVRDYWKRNQKHMEEAYAEVF